MEKFQQMDQKIEKMICELEESQLTFKKEIAEVLLTAGARQMAIRS